METSIDTSPQEISLHERNLAALSYLWIMSILVFFFKKDSAFVRYHALQGLVLFVLSLLLWFVPIINTGLEFFLGIFMILGFIKASQGDIIVFPFLSNIIFSDNPIKILWNKSKNSLLYARMRIQSDIKEDLGLKDALDKMKQSLEQPSVTLLTKEEKNNDLAAFSYVWILSVVITSLHPNNKFIHFHAKQGIVLFVASVFFSLIPEIGFFLNCLILILSILGFIMAFSGEYYSIPIVSFFAEQNDTFEDLYLAIKASILYMGHLLKRAFSQKTQKQTWKEIRNSLIVPPINTFTEISQAEKDMAIASYCGLGPIMWGLHRKKPFVVFHAKQSSVLLICMFLFFIVPHFQILIALCIAMMIIGIIESSHGHHYRMPLIYDLLNIDFNIQRLKKSVTTVGSYVSTTGKTLFASDTPKTPNPPNMEHP